MYFFKYLLYIPILDHPYGVKPYEMVQSNTTIKIATYF